MPHAATSLPAVKAPAARPALQPLVLVDDVPEPRLVVDAFHARMPLDTREIELSVEPTTPMSVIDHWLDAEVVVGSTFRLVDQSPRFLPLGRGYLREVKSDLETWSARKRFVLAEHWTRLLRRPPQRIFAEHGGGNEGKGTLVRQTTGTLQPGVDSNRSANQYQVNGKWVHVIRGESNTHEQRWTLGNALRTLSALADLDLSLNLIPPEIADSPLLRPIDLARAVGDSLVDLLQPYGLVMQRGLDPTPGHRAAVRPIGHVPTNQLRLPPQPNDPAHGQVVGIEADEPTPAARQWVARGSSWLVESTFTLVAGWDANLETVAASEYDRATSSDFATYRNVFRRWVLNEGGRFSDPPFNRGPAFDLTAFFKPPPGELDLDATDFATGEPIAPRPLRFEPTVTVDDAGRALPPRIELSVDGGSTWSGYGGEARLLNDRAGVYFDDAALDADYLAAAKDGQVRVRITASLRSPCAVELRRWTGNPFTGIRPAKIVNGSHAFAFRRIDPTSKYHDEVAAGQRASRAVDQTDELVGWLTGMLDRAERGGELSEGKATLTLVGARPEFTPGTRLRLISGDPRQTSGMSDPRRNPAVIESVSIRFAVDKRQADTPRTVITLRY